MSGTTKKRFQVFISSTFRDLERERFAVMKAIMGLDCIPAGMEDFPAFDEDQLQYIKKAIDDSDYYILIIGGRYGSVDEDGISFTEREYHYATERGKPVLAFIHADVGSLAYNLSEADPNRREKLDRFRNHVMTGRIVRTWSTAENLAGAAVIALSQSIRMRPQTGWTRGDSIQVNDLLGELAVLRRQIQETSIDLDRKDRELSALQDQLGKDADDATGLLRRAELFEELIDEGHDGSARLANRESIRIILERVLALALDLKATANDVYNCGVTATRQQFPDLALQLHTVAHHLQNSKSHWLAKLHCESRSGKRLEVLDGEDGLKLQRDMTTNPITLGREVLTSALITVSNAPVAQCEIIYGQAWNIFQEYRETDALHLARSLLIFSSHARSGRIDLVHPVKHDEFNIDVADWSDQVGKPTPSCMFEKIAQMTIFLAGHDWMDEAEAWIIRGVQQISKEPPSVTWHESTLRALSIHNNIVETSRKRSQATGA